MEKNATLYTLPYPCETFEACNSRQLSPSRREQTCFFRSLSLLCHGSWSIDDSMPYNLVLVKAITNEDPDVLSCADPDVPTRKGYNREFRHWLVGNIPEENVAKGEVLAEYVGPAPPKGSGKHRYVFLVYKQNQGSITFDERRLSNR